LPPVAMPRSCGYKTDGQVVRVTDEVRRRIQHPRHLVKAILRDLVLTSPPFERHQRVRFIQVR
jgi:hypothetical protein